ncbi:MAG: hypothetical protein ABFD04_00435 [Syntrophomonas sp.]
MTINIRKMNWFVRLITFGWPDAITIMPFGIYIKPDYLKDEQTIRHELIHARQQLEMLILFFYLWYLVEWLIRLVLNWKMAYMSVSFEREAYRNDDNSEYLAGRKRLAWLSYLRQDRRFKVKIYYTSGKELIRLRNEINQ